MTLVCGTDFSDGSAAAVAAASALASRLAPDDLWFVHVLDAFLQQLDPAAHEQARASAEHRLQALGRDA